MNTVEFIDPDGNVVEVPEADAPHFDEKGWKRVNENEANTNEPGKRKKKGEPK